MERDAYKYKVHRVNHELLRSLKANKVHPKVHFYLDYLDVESLEDEEKSEGIVFVQLQFLDIDSVITENDYLQERLNSVQNQLDTMNQKLEKCNVSNGVAIDL